MLFVPYNRIRSFPQIMTGFTTDTARKQGRRDKGLVLIASYKLLAALVFAAVGVGAMRLVGKDVGDVLSELASNLRFNPESRFVNFVLDRASLLDDPALRRIGFGAFCYAAIGVVEALGLYFEKVWAEYLTLLITASFLPLEVIEIMHRLTWVRVTLLAANVVVLIYLFMVVAKRQKSERVEQSSALK
jgi:uncharacterized membrane protein (DUF2068 family)